MAAGSTDTSTAVRCRRCSYDLRGLKEDGRCPECGLEIECSTLISRLIAESSSIPDQINFGILLGSLGIALAAAALPIGMVMWAGTGSIWLALLPSFTGAILRSISIHQLGTIDWAAFRPASDRAFQNATRPSAYAEPMIMILIAIFIVLENRAAIFMPVANAIGFVMWGLSLRRIAAALFLPRSLVLSGWGVAGILITTLFLVGLILYIAYSGGAIHKTMLLLAGSGIFIFALLMIVRAGAMVRSEFQNVRNRTVACLTVTKRM